MSGCRHAQTVIDSSFSYKIDYVALANDIISPEWHHNCIIGLKVMPILLKWMDFAYWWSFIGKGLSLQPAQQACLLHHLLSWFAQVGLKNSLQSSQKTVPTKFLGNLLNYPLIWRTYQNILNIPSGEDKTTTSTTQHTHLYPRITVFMLCFCNLSVDLAYLFIFSV